MKNTCPTIYFVLSLLFVIPVIAEEDNNQYYFDEHNNHLEKYDFIWDNLYNYFGEETPEKFIINYIDGDTSRFDCDSNKVILAKIHSELLGIVGHESSHVALCKLTSQTNIMTRFRFFDEGFAVVFGQKINGTEEKYKQYALGIAATQVINTNLSFIKVQDWDTYFGDWRIPNTLNNYAYPVGSSFIYFMIDTYGESSLFQFFKSIGETKSLYLTFEKLFKKSLIEIEKEWQDYLLTKVK